MCRHGEATLNEARLARILWQVAKQLVSLLEKEYQLGKRVGEQEVVYRKEMVV
jgi:hypothetical protein